MPSSIDPFDARLNKPGKSWGLRNGCINSALSVRVLQVSPGISSGRKDFRLRTASCSESSDGLHPILYKPYKDRSGLKWNRYDTSAIHQQRGCHCGVGSYFGSGPSSSHSNSSALLSNQMARNTRQLLRFASSVQQSALLRASAPLANIPWASREPRLNPCGPKVRTAGL